MSQSHSSSCTEESESLLLLHRGVRVTPPPAQRSQSHSSLLHRGVRVTPLSCTEESESLLSPAQTSQSHPSSYTEESESLLLLHRGVRVTPPPARRSQSHSSSCKEESESLLLLQGGVRVTPPPAQRSQSHSSSCTEESESLLLLHRGVRLTPVLSLGNSESFSARYRLRCVTFSPGMNAPCKSGCRQIDLINLCKAASVSDYYLSFIFSTCLPPLPGISRQSGATSHVQGFVQVIQLVWAHCEVL